MKNTKNKYHDKTLQNLIQRVKEHHLLSDNDELYDEKKHRNWDMVNLSIEDNEPVTFSIIEYKLNNGKNVYAISDKEGYVASPPENLLISTSIYSEPLLIENKYDNIKAYLIIAGIILLIIFSYIAAPLGLYLRDLNDPIRKASIRAGEEFNAARVLLKKDWAAQQRALDHIYIYTNDTDVLETSIEPNLKFYNNSYAPNFVNLQGEADDIKDFLQNKDKLGYNIKLKTDSGSFTLINTGNKSKAKDFILVGIFYYDKKTIEHLRKRIESRPNKPTYKFYFASFKTDIGEQAFEENITPFLELFLKNQDTFECCEVRKIPLKKVELDFPVPSSE